MPVSLEQFIERIVESSLMSDVDVKAVVDGVHAEQRPRDADQLARLLVKQKKLTAFQAQQIYSGKGKSLVLGNYLILDKLGQGGMGMVLKAEHRRMERIVALIRGGGWHSARGCRSAYRNRGPLSYRNDDLGFRVLRALTFPTENGTAVEPQPAIKDQLMGKTPSPVRPPPAGKVAVEADTPIILGLTRPCQTPSRTRARTTNRRPGPPSRR